jgi:hypothetical protein
MTHRRPPGAARVGTHVAVGARLIRGGLKEAAETGAIGADALSTLVRMRGLADVPLLVETPTHPEDVALLKQWRCGPTKPDQTA